MEPITRIDLPCGMPLIVEHMGGVKSAAMSWLVPAGAASEPANRLGLSALWGELLCRGAGEHDSRAHADALDRLGVNRSVSPGGRFIRIGISLVGNRLNDALPLLVDVVRRPRFDAESIEPSRELALQAIRSLDDDPHERAVIAARANHLPDPLGRSNYGTVDGLQAVTRDDIISGWRTRALPGGSILALAGDVDAQHVASQLQALLDGWEGSSDEPAPGPTPQRGVHHIEDDTNQVQIVLVHDAPREADDDAMLERVVTNVLSGGMSGRLFTEVREKRGLCYAVSAGYRGARDFGIASAYVGTTPERAATSLDVLREQLDLINTPDGRVTDEEFDRAIVGLKAGLVLSGESSSARASSLATDVHNLGRARSLDELATQIDAITLEDVHDYTARRSLGTTTIVTLGPEPIGQ